MVSILPMPAFRLSGQGYDFRGINSAFNNVRQQNNANENRLLRRDQMDQQQDQFEQGQDLRVEQMQNSQGHRNQMLALREKELAATNSHRDRTFGLQEKTTNKKLEAVANNRFAGIAQTIQRERDPAKQADMWRRVVGMHPEIMKRIPAELHNDPIRGSQYAIAAARGYVEPNKGGYAKQPIYGTDASGKPVIMQLSPSGRATQTQLPPGVTPSTGSDKIDLGTQWGIIDKRSGQITGYMPKDITGAASARAAGTAQGKARIKLPMVMNEAKRIDKYINDVLNHPALGRSTGTMSGYLPNVTPGAVDFDQRLGQLQGKAFTSAFERLKGAGAVTEAEGAKAGQALARLQQATVGTENFKTALKDFQAEMKLLVRQAKQNAGGAPRGRQEPANNDPLGIR